MRRLIVATLLLFALSVVVLAQTTSKAVVGVEPLGPGSPVAAGTSFEGSITLRIKAGYHINAQKPTEDYLIGTNVDLKPPAGVTVTKVGYPSARYAKFSFSETALAVYEGTVKITITMKLDPSTTQGPMTIPGKVRFQACNDQQCLPPSTVDVSIPVEVGAAAAATTTETPEDEETQSLTLSGAPPEAVIMIDGRPVGRANALGRFVAKDLKKGRYRVRVEHEGFESWEQTVNMNGTNAQTVNVVLAASPVATETASAPPPVSDAPAPVTPAPQTPPATVEPAPAAAGSNTALYVLIAVAVLALAGFGVYAATRKQSHI